MTDKPGSHTRDSNANRLESWVSRIRIASVNRAISPLKSSISFADYVFIYRE